MTRKTNKLAKITAEWKTMKTILRKVIRVLLLLIGTIISIRGFYWLWLGMGWTYEDMAGSTTYSRPMGIGLTVFLIYSFFIIGGGLALVFSGEYFFSDRKSIIYKWLTHAPPNKNIAPSIKCPKCNKVYDSTWKICLRCNVPLDEKERVVLKKYKPSISNPLCCPKCGRGYDKSWKVCLECRIPLVENDNHAL